MRRLALTFLGLTAFLGFTNACVGDDKVGTVGPDASASSSSDGGGSGGEGGTQGSKDGGSEAGTLSEAVTDVERLHVFVTSETFSGDITEDGADEACNKAGAKADPRGHYVAWISRGLPPVAPARAILNGVPASSKWVSTKATNPLVFGKVPGNGDFPLSPLDADENGNAATGEVVWTGQAVDDKGADNCNDWKVKQGSQLAFTGITGSLNADWYSHGNPLPCDTPHRLYCFQRPEAAIRRN